MKDDVPGLPKTNNAVIISCDAMRCDAGAIQFNSVRFDKRSLKQMDEKLNGGKS